jgi:magnesium transporter
VSRFTRGSFLETTLKTGRNSIMNMITSYRLEKDSLVKAVPYHGLQRVPGQLEADAVYWIEVDNPTDKELEETLKGLGLHPLILEDCFKPEHSSLIDYHPDAVYMEFPTNGGETFRTISYLSIICLPSLLITIRRGEIPRLSQLVASLENDRPLDSGNTGNLIYRMMDFFIAKATVARLLYRSQLDILEDMLEQDSNEVDPQQLAKLNQQLTQLEAILEDQLLCARSLVSHVSPVIETNDQEAYFRDLVNDAEHGLRALGRLKGRLKDMQNNFELLHHEASEKRLRILTVISAVFLPLTFITGFFGMNFVNMQVLQWKDGLAVFTMIMLLISLAMLWFFRSRGWFD